MKHAKSTVGSPGPLFPKRLMGLDACCPMASASWSFLLLAVQTAERTGDHVEQSWKKIIIIIITDIGIDLNDT